MNIHEEKQYLKELKFTHENLVKKGKLYNAENTHKLIEDCEKRIESMSKVKQSVLVGETIWKPIKGWENSHLISNTGLIKKRGYYSTSKFGVERYYQGGLVALIEEQGYIRSILTSGNKLKRYVISNLVYEHFIGEIPLGYMAKNKDGNMHNNESTNLFLVKVIFSPKRLRNKENKFA